MRPIILTAMSVAAALPLVAKIPESMYTNSEAIYQDAELAIIAEQFRTAEKINVLFKDQEARKRKVTMALHAVPKFVILQYAARAAGLQCAYKSYGAVFEKGTALHQHRTPAGRFAVSLHKKISVDLEQPTLEEIVQLLAQVHKVNIVFVHPEQWTARKIESLTLTEVSILQMVTYLSDLFNVPITMDKYAVFIGEKKQTGIPDVEKMKTGNSSAGVRKPRPGRGRITAQ